MRNRILLIVLCCSMLTATANDAKHPNILFILVDDLGWSDLSCYGHKYHQTPNIDRLAAEGLRFTNGYAPAPICSASRASILTGKTPARLGFEFVTKNDPGHQQLDAKVPLTTPNITLNLPTSDLGENRSDLDGISFQNVFTNPSWRPERNLIWHFPYYHPEKTFSTAIDNVGVDDFATSKTRPQSAVRNGNHKLVQFAEDDRVELYDLAADVSEQHDLSREQPRLTAELRADLEQQLKSMNARRAVPRQ